TLANANQALAAQSWDAAQTAATAVLGFDPQNAEARQILLKAQEAKRKQQRRAQTASQPVPGEVTTAPPVTSQQPVRPAAPAAQPQATTATLRIHFRSEVPEATVIVYANRKEIFRKTYGGGGLFHKGGGPIEATETVSPPIQAGTYDFLVSVTPSGKK